MSLSAAVQARAELHPEPALETVADLVTDIREAAEEIHPDATHLDMDTEPGYAPRIQDAWAADPVDANYGRLVTALVAPGLTAEDRLDIEQWIGDTFAALLDREPGDEIAWQIRPGVWRLDLNPPTGL